MYRKNTAGQFLCVQLILTATGAVATGLSPAARRCIDGTFAAGGGSFTEDGSTGSYKYALAQADTNGNDISIIVTATGAIPVAVNFVTTAADPTDAVHFGLTSLPNTAVTTNGSLLTSGTGTAQISNSSGQVIIQSGTGTGQLSFTSGIAKVDVDTIKTNPVVNGGTITFPTTATLASTTNITAGTVTTATNVTNVNGLAAGVITATSIAADAITAAKIADGAIDAATFAAGAIDATAIAANAIGASELATDAVTEIADGILARDIGSGSNAGSSEERTVRSALRFLRNKWAISGTTLTVRAEDDSTAMWTSTVTPTAGANPITANDPT